MPGTGTQPVAFPRVSGAVRRDIANVRGAGRFGDTQLAHLSPKADAFLRRQGGAGTRNPETGLKEHFSLRDLVGVLAPVALNILAPGVGSSIGETIGLSGAAANMAGNAIVGGGIGALTGGKRGALIGAGTGAALAGLKELGGFQGLGDRLGIGGGGTQGGQAVEPDARGLDILKTEVQPPGLEGVPVGPGEMPTPPPPTTGGIAQVAGTAPSVRGATGVPAGTTADKGGMDWGKLGLAGGAALLLGGGLNAPQMPEEEAPPTLAAGFGGPLPKYELDRTAAMPSDQELLLFGRGYGGRPGGTFYDAPGRYRQYKDGGDVKKPEKPKGAEKWNPYEKYDEFRKPGTWRGDEVVPNTKPSSRPRAAAAERLQELGRNGDTILAHINPREAALLRAAGGSGTVNPNTGLLEFSDVGVGESWSGGGSETSVGGFGGGVTADNIGGDSLSGQAGGQLVDLSPEDQSRIEQGGLFSPSFGSDPMGYLGDKAKSWAANVRDNPIQSALNFAASFTPIGTLNTLAGLLTGHTIGSLATAGGRAVGDMTGLSNVAAQTSPDAPAPTQALGGADSLGAPSPTQNLVTAPSTIAQLAAEAPTPAAPQGWSRSMSMPSDLDLLSFGRGYGGRQGGTFYSAPNMTYAKDGGEITDGRSDDVPAMLSEGEHVLDAEFVALAGNGSNEAGHKRIEKWKADLRRQKGKALAKGKISPNAKMPKVA